MVYANPNGHDWTNVYNWDGLGISYVAFGVTYSILFYAMCGIVWYHRKNPVVKMRKPKLAIASLLILHVYLFLTLLDYTLNGHVSCDTEFWLMSFLLPMGIGLFQAQTQRLLLVSHVQNKLIMGDEIYITLGPRRGPKKWKHKLVQWWRQSTEQGSYEGYVAVGMVAQVVVSAVIFFISRKFTGLGIVSQKVSNGMCRRGWEWAPSIIWQCSWTWILGPMIIWKVRKIQDIYHWRLQTILCIVAGLPGAPLWLLSAYHDAFAPVDKYWTPAAWFVPGLITMEMATLGFTIWQLIKNLRQSHLINQNLAEHGIAHELGLAGNSVESFLSKRGERFSMQDLEQCLLKIKENNGFLVYLGSQTFGVENASFLLKVQCFKRQWDSVFQQAGTETERARMALYRAALNIFICLVSLDTAIWAINISSREYKALDGLFGEATNLVAKDRPGESKGTYSRVSPWDEPATDHSNNGDGPIEMAPPRLLRSPSEESFDFVIKLDDSIAPDDPLAGFKVPEHFSRICFDVAYGHIMQVVWTGPWQQYQNHISGAK